MEVASQIDHLTTFEFKGMILPVEFVETLEVTKGVRCHVYNFVGDDSKDLGIIEIEPGCKTPLQLVNDVEEGQKTIEGFVSGEGTLKIKRKSGANEIYIVSNKIESPLSKDVEVGDNMQWTANADSKLIAYEICIPKYKDGRYTNLPEEVEIQDK
jgi:hypothetical protein